MLAKLFRILTSHLTLHWTELGRALFTLMVVDVVEIFLFHRAQPVNYRAHESMVPPARSPVIAWRSYEREGIPRS